jgi:hypothetical protein
MKLKRPQKSDLWKVAVFALAGWLAHAYMWANATKSLSDLTKLTAVLDSASTEISPGRATPFVVVLHLKDNLEQPGIFIGSSAESARELAAEFHRGDTLTIYYDATGVTTSHHVNLHTYQVQHQRQIIYSLAQSKHRHMSGVWGSGIIAAFATCGWLFLLFLRKRKPTT